MTKYDNSPFMKPFLALVKEQLKSNDALTVIDIAQAVGIPYSTFSKYSDGSMRYGLKNLVYIADYYNVSTDFLLSRTDIRDENISLAHASELIGLSNEALIALRLHTEMVDCPHTEVGSIPDLPKQIASNSDWLDSTYEFTEKRYFLTKSEILHLQSMNPEDVDSELEAMEEKHAQEVEAFMRLKDTPSPTNPYPRKSKLKNSTATIISEILQHAFFYSHIIPAIKNIKALNDERMPTTKLEMIKTLFSTPDIHNLLIEVASTEFKTLLKSLYPVPQHNDTDQTLIDLTEL